MKLFTVSPPRRTLFFAVCGLVAGLAIAAVTASILIDQQAIADLGYERALVPVRLCILMKLPLLLPYGAAIGAGVSFLTVPHRRRLRAIADDPST